MAKILLATSPFAQTGRKPLDLLEVSGHTLVFNPYGRRFRAGEVAEHLRGVDAVVAGTEPYDEEILAHADCLKVISRVGIGLDSIDLQYCQSKNISVTYTPDAPTQGVAELTVSNMINLIRHVHQSDCSVRENAWNRLMGSLVSDVKIGLIGVGRIGTRVIELLQPFHPQILAYDSDPAVCNRSLPGVRWCSLDELLGSADMISVHIPMNEENRYFIDRQKISKMKTGSGLINTSRGGVLDTQALTDALLQKHLRGAALDVFETEPYEGPLTKLDNVILTAHIAASAKGSRFLMELGAVEDCLRVLGGNEPEHNALEGVL